MRSGSILILEADRRLRMSRAGTLSRAGYSVTTAATVEEAMQAARREGPDLLIVGAHEPGLVNSAMAQLPPGTGVLVIAAEGTIGQACESAGAGVHSFLVPPFAPRKLKERVSRAIESARQVREDIGSRVLASLAHAGCMPAWEGEIDLFFKSVVETGAAATGADFASLAVRDRATGEFVTRAQVGNCPPGWEAVCQQATDAGEIVFINERAHDHSRLRGLILQAGVSAVLCAPLTVRGEAVGALTIMNGAGKAPFTPGALQLVSILAWWSSMALENAWLLDRVQRQHLHVERLLREITSAQENERRRLAVEIHDGVAQWMVGASYGIRTCCALASELRLDELQQELAETRETVQRSIKELRRTIADLRPLPLEELGLVDAIRQTGEALAEEGITCHTEVGSGLPGLSAGEETTTYRIVQEVLTNVRRHSGATEVTIRMQYHDSTFSVEVSDNGRGFVPQKVTNNERSPVHMGLVGMRERAELLGGYLTIDSGRGRGTAIRFAFPVSEGHGMKATATPRD